MVIIGMIIVMVMAVFTGLIVAIVNDCSTEHEIDRMIREEV